MSQNRENLVARFRTMSTPELHRAFTNSLRITAEHLERVALILQELENREEVVEGVSVHLLDLLRKIARGEVLAEVVPAFAGTPMVLARVAKLPVTEQEEILRDSTKQEELTRRKPRPSRSKSFTKQREEDEENYILMAEIATAKDLAETIAEMIGRHPEPAEVWRILCGMPEIARLAAKSKMTG